MSLQAFLTVGSVFAIVADNWITWRVMKTSVEEDCEHPLFSWTSVKWVIRMGNVMDHLCQQLICRMYNSFKRKVRILFSTGW